MQMTKKELKYVNSLKEENDRVKNLLLCFVNAIKEVQTTEDIEKIWLIPCLGEKAKKVRAEIKAEAYKEFAERLCEGKVSNSLVVIEAKCLLKELVGDDNA